MTVIANYVDSPINMPALAGWFIAVYGIWTVVAKFQSWYRLSHIPGPRLAALSYLWVALCNYRKTSATEYRNLKKYGSLVRVGPNYLVTDDPEVLRKIAGLRSNYKRDSWYSSAKFRPDIDTIGSIMDNNAHDALKAKVASGYSGKENPDLEVAVDSQVSRLVDLIRRKYVSSGESIRVVDFSLLSRYFTMDVITRLGHSKEFGYLDDGDDIYGWVAQADKMLAAMVLAMDVPWIRQILFSRIGLSLFGPKPTDKTGVGKVMDVTSKLVGERFKPDAPKHSDMFNGFIRRGITQKELEGEAMIQLFAGVDTTASAIRTIMLYVIQTPRVYNRLREEINVAVSQGNVASPISNAQAMKIPYLQAIIWEGYRIRCPVAFGHYKVVPPGGDTINGMYVPAGTAVGHNSAALTHRQDIFGLDADVFRPERFLECSPERKLEMDRALEMTFGGGRWTCAGKSIATMELNKVLFELFRNFDFQLTDPTKPWVEASFQLQTHSDMFMRIAELSTKA